MVCTGSASAWSSWIAPDVWTTTFMSRCIGCQRPRSPRILSAASPPSSADSADRAITTTTSGHQAPGQSAPASCYRLAHRRPDRLRMPGSPSGWLVRTPIGNGKSRWQITATMSAGPSPASASVSTPCPAPFTRSSSAPFSSARSTWSAAALPHIFVSTFPLQPAGDVLAERVQRYMARCRSLRPFEAFARRTPRQRPRSRPEDGLNPPSGWYNTAHNRFRSGAETRSRRRPFARPSCHRWQD